MSSTLELSCRPTPPSSTHRKPWPEHTDADAFPSYTKDVDDGQPEQHGPSQSPMLLSSNYCHSNNQTRPEAQDGGGRKGNNDRRGQRWWKIRLFKGMINDVKRRAPYYASDWLDAWDYRVVPATVYMYFAKYDGHFYLVSWGEKGRIADLASVSYRRSRFRSTCSPRRT